MYTSFKELNILSWGYSINLMSLWRNIKIYLTKTKLKVGLETAFRKNTIA